MWSLWICTPRSFTSSNFKAHGWPFSNHLHSNPANPVTSTTSFVELIFKSCLASVMTTLTSLWLFLGGTFNSERRLLDSPPSSSRMFWLSWILSPPVKRKEFKRVFSLKRSSSLSRRLSSTKQWASGKKLTYSTQTIGNRHRHDNLLVAALHKLHLNDNFYLKKWIQTHSQSLPISIWSFISKAKKAWFK